MTTDTKNIVNLDLKKIKILNFSDFQKQVLNLILLNFKVVYNNHTN